MQASLAIVGFIAALAAWLANVTVWWLVGGITLVAVVPLTLIVVFPTNKKLLDPSLN